MDSTVHLSLENSRQYGINPAFPIDFLIFIDNKWITKNYDFHNPDSSFVELDPYTLEPKRYFGSLPATGTDEGSDARLRLVENLANAAVKPDGGKFVLSYKFRDLIEIYNANGDLERTITGPENNLPVLSESTIKRFDPIPIIDKTWYVYSKVLAKDDGFYVGYIGKKEPPLSVYPDEGLIDKQYNTSSYSNIFKFNWEGELLARYNLDIPISSFEVDEEAHVIYATSGYIEEGIIGYWY